MTAVMPEKLNARAVKVIKRVQQKLDGRDFTTTRVAKAGESSPGTTRYYGFGGEGDEVNKAGRGRVLSVEEQVDRLILQASSDENLCQSYIGWYVAPASASAIHMPWSHSIRPWRPICVTRYVTDTHFPSVFARYVPLLATPLCAPLCFRCPFW